MMDVIAAALDEQLCVRGDGGGGIKIMNGAPSNLLGFAMDIFVAAVAATSNIDL